MPSISPATFQRLVAPGPRLPWIQDWLLGEVWSPARYAALDPIDYLKQGESEVNALEEVIAAAAPRIYDELAAPPPPDRDLRAFLESSAPCAAVVFDGLSLRELPLALTLAQQSGRRVRYCGVSLAGLPSDTQSYIEQRLRTTAQAPSQLTARADLRDVGIVPYYFNSPSQINYLNPGAPALLLWSVVPDMSYADSGARFPEHFKELHAQFETAWMNTVQQIPKDRPVLVTSDHGYVFFGHGYSFLRDNTATQALTAFLGGERFRRLPSGDQAPTLPDLAVLPNHQVAMIRGRVQTHPTGPASTRLYKHGGLSLMEILTPWLVLE